MERVMSVEDKIRRAEEIYYKRRLQEIPKVEKIKTTRKYNKYGSKIVKKMIKQIVICLIIYSIFYMIINNNYIFSEDFTNKAKQILSQDINFVEIYNSVKNKIDEYIKPKENETVEQNQTIEPTSEENIGGAEEPVTEEIINEPTNTENSSTEEGNIEGTVESNLTQMEQDALQIKQTISFIKPIAGTITSRYGLRNPTTATVPKNHKGTDIAAERGTKIISATDGKVVLASSEGDYGKHLKIQINDVIIVYAHCNKLYVNEGDEIKQGQEIAEVGSTGNATGPHLHFEVRLDDRYVDPQLILEL